MHASFSWLLIQNLFCLRLNFARGPGGILNFHFGKDVRPEGPQLGA